MKRWMKYLVMLLCAMVIFLCGGLVVIWRSASTGFGTVTDIKQYPEILGSFETSDSLQHFPTAIPHNAIKADFYYRPRVMQGGTIMQLRLKLPEDEFTLENESYAANAIYIFQPDLAGKPIPLPVLRAGNEGSFPKTFDIMVLGAESAGNDTYQWNHGTTYGIAVDKENSEIVYWYERW